MKKSSLYRVIILAAAFLPGLALAQAGFPVDIASSSASLSTSAENPGEYAYDGDGSTGWSLKQGATSGRLELTLSKKTLLAGISLDGDATESVKIGIELLGKDGWIKSASTRYRGLAGANEIAFLSLDNIVTDRIAITVERTGQEGFFLHDIEVIGTDIDSLVTKIRPITISESTDSSIFREAKNLCDGNPLTAWGTEENDPNAIKAKQYIETILGGIPGRLI